jgi:hypothetical protein
MTSRASQQDRKDPGGESTSDVFSSVRTGEEPGSTLAETQGAMLKDLVTAQLTALEAFERLIASTGPASEDLMNQFSRELMLGLFRLYPVSQEISRHSLSAMTELAREFSTVLRSAVGGVEGVRVVRSETDGDPASKANSATE